MSTEEPTPTTDVTVTTIPVITKQSFAIPSLDCRIIKGLAEKIGAAKANFDRQLALLMQVSADFDEYKARFAPPNTDLTGYQINYLTEQLEPIPPKPALKEPVIAPNSTDPPAPFREADKVP